MTSLFTGVDPAPPTSWEPHSHPAHELVWVHDGTMTSLVTTADGDRIFTVPAGHGIWIPATLTHSGTLTSGVTLFGTLFSPERTPAGFGGDPAVVAMTPVLESLLTHLGRTDLTSDARARAEAVVFDVMEPPTTRLELPLPGDPRIDGVARALLDNPGDSRGLEAWGREVGCSARTVARAFQESTGLSFGRWRQALRIQHSLSLLGAGRGVDETAGSLGYAQTSTFIAAFRRVMGTTPGRYTATTASRRTVS